MERREKAPYVSQDVGQIKQLLQNLQARTGKGRGGRHSSSINVRKKTFTLPEKNNAEVQSWQMNDWDYKRPDLPTYARGLFTRQEGVEPEIVVRGYDKFFNINEVRETEWRNIEVNTRGPYELSVKENGCIIFIAGLDDETLLVTSKHSTGARQDLSANHSAVGEEWVDKQLKSIGKTQADLAKALRSMNATAVAELCDDEFEEHVLPYAPEDAGLYLHGINLNLPEFVTYPGNLVDKFADQWGFRKTMYVVEEEIQKVRKFLEQVAETGNYDGRDTEGFVIRCQARATKDSPWEDWFFKYKFEEPYLMYRQWRECTKSVISGKAPKFKKHKKITEEYLLYARRQLAKDKNLGKQYNQNHGIIAMREGFLKEKGMKGSDIIRNEELDGGEYRADQVRNNVVLVPAATIGCGKTTVAVALSKLFDWGHEQNDNIQGKGSRAQRFSQAITNSLALYPVVIADRNNHQRREREQLITDVSKIVPDVKFVCLHWVHDRANYNEIREAMRARVFSRGDKHQTIQADTQGEEHVNAIMEGFLKRFEPVNPSSAPDDGFDLVIDLDVTAESLENVQTVVKQLHDEFPNLFEMPSDQAVEEAVSFAITGYKPTQITDIGQRSSKKAEKQKNKTKETIQQNSQVPATSDSVHLEYFGVFVDPQRIIAILDAVFASEHAETARFYRQLKASRRIQAQFHVTLMHRVSASQHQSYWGNLSSTWRSRFDAMYETSLGGNGAAPSKKQLGGNDGGVDLGSCRVKLDRIVWDDRVMAIAVQLPDTNVNGFSSTNAHPHITIGTGADGIKPFESNNLLQRWTEGSDPKISTAEIKGNVALEGSVRGIVSR